MWRRVLSWIVLACAVAAAPEALAMRPRVLLTVALNVPYVARWERVGLLAPIKNMLLEYACGKLDQFAYLQWVNSGTAETEVVLIVEPDPNSPPGAAHPWVLSIARKIPVPRAGNWDPIPFASAAEVHELYDQRDQKKEVLAWFARAMVALDNDANANQFVASVLYAIDVANEVTAPLKPNVRINASMEELQKKQSTELSAMFRRRTTGQPVELTLQPLDEVVPAHTECAVLPYQRAGEAVSEVQDADRSKKVSVFVSRYEGSRNPSRTGITTTSVDNKQKPGCSP